MTALLVCCGPLFVFTMSGWSNAVLFVGAFLSLVLLFGRTLPPPALPPADRRWMWAVILAFAAPIVAAAISALLRDDFFHRQFDSPSRFLLGIPVFLFMLRSRHSAAGILQLMLPVALVLTLAQLEVVGPDPRWPPDRDTTHYVDPLVFGYLTLAFGLMCLMSISPGEWRRGSRLGVLLRLAALALGLYLSVRSGSRTGWAAVPIVVGVWLHHHWGRGHRLATAVAIGVAALIPVALYLTVPPVSARVDMALREIAGYSWNSVPEETSIGLRITYLRIAADVFAQHPFAGIGDTGRVVPASLGSFGYASPLAVAAAFESAFHNQLVSNAVRNGIPGLVATAALLFVPLLLFARALRHGVAAARKDACMGLAFSTCIVVSSLTTEVVDLKFAAALYTLMAAVLCGAALGRRDEALSGS